MEAPDTADVVPPEMAGLTPAAHVAQTDQAAAAEAVQAPNARVAELADQVADRILVSMPRGGNDGEVRITLKESVLEGSDVRIFREDGQLRVVFVAQTEAAERFLATNRAALQQTLGDRLPEERPQVEVSTPEGRGASGEDNEGRSRQQYVPQDDPADLT